MLSNDAIFFVVLLLLLVINIQYSFITAQTNNAPEEVGRIGKIGNSKMLFVRRSYISC